MTVEVHEMITYVKMKNFMSFKDIMFDFRNGNKGAKKFISIYGENGSGKSNFVTCIDLLRKSIESFQIPCLNYKLSFPTSKFESKQNLIITIKLLCNK